MLAGLRAHYLPSMVALQLEMYQLSRLLRDAHHDLFRHLKRNVPLLATHPTRACRVVSCPEQSAQLYLYYTCTLLYTYIDAAARRTWV